ncbi:MAG: DNA polymerase II large subunit, partial [Candidatus Nanohaloarchaea archaeon]
MNTEKYFEEIREKTEKAYDIAEEARDQSKDPEQRVDIPVAEDLAEKASSLVIAAQFPELEDQGVAERIRELEDEYGKNDERVSFSIAREIAEGNFHEFDDLELACEAGVRVGVSYMTGGITTAPLEGIGDVRIRENSDGTEYLAVYYSGPIRSAGGTASAMSVLLADYVRIGVGLDRFKPSETVVNRYAAEVDDYYTRVTAKQYYPEREETSMIAENVPVEVTGSPTEQLEVSNYKDLDRIDTNRIRGGMCLVYLDGLPLKAPKIKKRIEKWGKDFGLEHWEWVEDYLDLQHEIHSSGDEEDGDSDEEEHDYTPSDKYLGSLTAGRPIFAHPGRKGGFRLRYGHTRTNGLAAVSMHPATLEISQRFIAIGTQLKTEYPMKGTVATPSDAAHPPVVKLKDGEVRKIRSREEAREVENRVEEILFMGDMIVTYGEFVENGKKLLPSPYVPEWWEKDLEHALEEQDVKLGRDFSDRDPSPEEAFKISEKLGIKLHPRWTYHWKDLDPEEFQALYSSLREGQLEGSKTKKALEKLLVQHRQEDGKIKLQENDLKALKLLLRPDEDNEDVVSSTGSSSEVVDAVQEISGVELGDPAPHYLGARMGRPEKAERRTLNGKPQAIFPCGKQEGGRMRNLSMSYENGEVEEQIIQNYCPECGEKSYFSYCQDCGSPTEPLWVCSECGKQYREEKDVCGSCGSESVYRYARDQIDIESIMDKALDNLGMSQPPELLKSFRGMTSKTKIVEPLEKGLLREKHDLYVNKDGTVRYDATDLPMTHFKPREAGVSVEKLRELGYREDINGEPLENEDQVLEMKPQDILIPDGDKTLAASDYMLRVAKFIDDLLEDFYGLEPYYNAESKEDLVGELVIGLAPHTSGGTVGRIIGFTDAKGIYSHPYWHAGKRRNCLPGDTEVKLADGTTKRLDEMFESGENGEEVDSTGTEEREVSEELISVKDGSVETEEAVKAVRAPAQNFKLKIETSSGRMLEAFPDHRLETASGELRARELEEGDKLLTPESISVEPRVKERIDLLEFTNSVSIKGVRDKTEALIEDLGGLKQASDRLDMSKKTLGNYKYRDSIPLEVFNRLKQLSDLDPDIGEAEIAARSDNVKLDRFVDLDSDFMKMLGYYLAEGYIRKSEKDGEEFYQVAFAFGEEDLKQNIKQCVENVFGITPSEGDHILTVSSRAVYDLFEGLEMGEGAHSKRVPDLAMKQSKELVADMLSAYFAGDGSLEKGRLHVQATSVSRELLQDIDTLLKRFGIYARFSSSEREAGGILLEKYGEEHYEGRTFTSNKLHIRSSHAKKFGEEIGFDLGRKQKNLEKDYELERSPREETEDEMVLQEVDSIEIVEAEERYMYDLEVKNTHNFITEENIVTHNCDGDEDAILMMMDGLLNFSRQYLPDATGARTMDAPLILSTVLNPDEVDDEAWAIETV